MPRSQRAWRTTRGSASRPSSRCTASGRPASVTSIRPTTRARATDHREASGTRARSAPCPRTRCGAGPLGRWATIRARSGCRWNNAHECGAHFVSRGCSGELSGVANAADARPVVRRQVTGTISCAKLSFTKGALKVAMDMTVSGTSATYAREVLNADGSRIVGTEEGTGKVAADGKLDLTATWKSADERPRYTYTASYSGTLSGKSGAIRGTQVWSFDGKTENRSCSIALKRG